VDALRFYFLGNYFWEESSLLSLAGVNPEHRMTGRRGYLGYFGSVSDNLQYRKYESRALVMIE